MTHQNPLPELELCSWSRGPPSAVSEVGMGSARMAQKPAVLKASMVAGVQVNEPSSDEGVRSSGGVKMRDLTDGERSKAVVDISF